METLVGDKSCFLISLDLLEQSQLVAKYLSYLIYVSCGCRMLFRTGSVDMVLVDEEAWGEGSGLTFPRSLRELQQKGSLKIHENRPKLFLLSTSLNPTEVDEVRSTGYVDSMIKPLRLSMMVACLRRGLGVGNTRCQQKRQPMALKTLLSEKEILVVDDNAVNRKVAEGALKKYGAIVTCADSGKVAIELLRPPHKFDACFMDVQMPEMDGYLSFSQSLNF